MNHSFKQVLRKQTNSSCSNWQNNLNKENHRDFFKDEKDISKILSYFNDLIQSNNQAIGSLRNEFTARATNGSLSKQQTPQCFNEDQQPSYIHGPDNSLNQTYLTISKQPHSYQLTRSEFNQKNLLNQKLVLIQNQIEALKLSQMQNSLNLEKRFSQKGEKSEIEKTLNLSRLLVIEINQIQERFKQNQKTTRIHQEQIKFLQQNIIKVNQKFDSQNIRKLQTISSQTSVQNQKTHQAILLKENLIKMFEVQLQQIAANKFSQIDEIKQKFLQNNQEKYQNQFNQVHTRLVNLQSHIQQFSTKSSNLFKEIKTQTQSIAKQMKKQEERIKKDSELQIFKKFDSLDKLYVKKSYFLQEKQENQSQLEKVSQSIAKVQNQMISRIQKLQKYLQSSQIMAENHNSQLLYKLNKLSSDQQEKIFETKQQIDKSLSKYAKTQAMKQFYQQQSEKILQTMNTNFQQQKQVNEVLCSQNILGRWLWQSQELKNGNLVSWDKEVINTLPQNFRFSLLRSTLIEIQSGGIYKFQLGFYSKKKPTIQILINGKVVMSAVNSSSYVIHHSSGKLKGIEPTEMSGLTLVDFFLIPEHSRIAIAYSGDVKGQGFMNIHRL